MDCGFKVSGRHHEVCLIGIHRSEVPLETSEGCEPLSVLSFQAQLPKEVPEPGVRLEP
jgi:hypothetical protein